MGQEVALQALQRAAEQAGKCEEEDKVGPSALISLLADPREQVLPGNADIDAQAWSAQAKEGIAPGGAVGKPAPTLLMQREFYRLDDLDKIAGLAELRWRNAFQPDQERLVGAT
ncbi:hypothetical protein BV509_21075 [Rhodovulum sulfidophilum]|uniref:Uncharacterized protein n=1 Tax=Rhodovulum visakhapatnamense TaxID=364297 RepID=A0ABS1RAZ9_9RHOB|nr:hypothetical protein [Rhodovulum visakhapatnamense]MBL3568939.1 hypothetical protein [Rhodovulum visakhapatnamense]MBL3576818.1 hypothetical protein [Rhodovulum visakhapatnamense]OLS42243.1 hypothetical protein BV509_21075 [Rhodovulum sulfidophilum]